MSKKGFIYKYTYPNGKVYIGQTRTTVKNRHNQHMTASKDPERRTICEIAIAKYGEPHLETIETFEVEDNESTKLIKLLNEAEKKWIEKYDSTNRKKGYNIQNGGKVVTPEEFILEEKFYEISEKEGLETFLNHVRNVLDNIINKNGVVGEDGEILDYHLKSSDLTKEERKVWYGVTFDSWCGEQISFNTFVKRCPCDYLDDIIWRGFEDLAEDREVSIWDRIMSKREKIIKDYFKK